MKGSRIAPTPRYVLIKRPKGTAMITDKKNANQTRPTLTTISEAKSRSVNSLTKAHATEKGVGRNSGLITPDIAVMCQATRNRKKPKIPKIISIL
jgi:hypothetical protein